MCACLCTYLCVLPVVLINFNITFTILFEFTDIKIFNKQQQTWKKFFILGIYALLLIVYVFLPMRILDINLSGDDVLLKPIKPEVNSSILSRIVNDKSVFLHIPNSIRNDSFIIIGVCSAITNIDKRQAIRTTWGQHSRLKRSLIKLIFVLGATQNQTLNNFVQREKEQFDDILQLNLLDSDAELTHKTLSFYKWISTNNLHTDFVVKCDDDTFVNTAMLIKLLSSIDPQQNILLGHLIRQAKPVHNSTYRWHLSRDQSQIFRRFKSRQDTSLRHNYNLDTNIVLPSAEQKVKQYLYPDYISGSAYITPFHLIDKIYKAAINQTVFWLEDIFITGIIANKQLNTTLVHLSNCIIAGNNTDPCMMSKLIAYHPTTMTQMEILWRDLQQKIQCDY